MAVEDLRANFGSFEGIRMRLGQTNDAVAHSLATVAAEGESEFFLGDDLLPFLTLAIGAALLFGTAAAFIRPPAERAEGALERPPVGRSVVQMAIGLIATVWALATLLS